MKGRRRIFNLTTWFIIISLLYIVISFYFNFYRSSAYAFITSHVIQLETREAVERVDIVDYEDIEVYSIDKEKVVFKEKSSPEAEAVGLSILGSITSLYVDVTPIPEKGYIVRLPFLKPIDFNEYWSGLGTTANINEIFIFLPQDKNQDNKRAPYLMILNNDAHPLFYNFNLDMNPFLILFNLGEFHLD